MCAILSHSVMELEFDGEPAHLEHFFSRLLCAAVRAGGQKKSGWLYQASPHPHVPTASLAYTRSTPVPGALIEAVAMSTNNRRSSTSLHAT